ncbi:transposase [Roseivivax sediminis]|uniref:transposase n=1 Tax=Roseivivax sediminis TaxID=936889 RepID=UPI00122CCBEB
MTSVTRASWFRALTRQFTTFLNPVGGHELRPRIETRSNPQIRRPRTFPGVGPVRASAIAATIGSARRFPSGRELAAWLGLTPANRSSSGKERVGPRRGRRGCPASRM